MRRNAPLVEGRAQGNVIIVEVLGFLLVPEVILMQPTPVRGWWLCRQQSEPAGP
jgi:hypothetical protein